MSVRDLLLEGEWKCFARVQETQSVYHQSEQQNAFRRRDVRQKGRSIGSTAYGDRARPPALRELMPPVVYVLPLLLCCYFSTPHHRGSENMGAFTLISVAPVESVAFSFKVSNLSLKSFALLFSVF